MSSSVMETGLALNALAVLAVVAGLASSSVLLGPRRRLSGEKGLPYETGMQPLEACARPMAASYQRFAVLFVIFDIDLSLVVPWVLLRRQLNLTAMISMSVFMALIGLTLAYAWRKGAIKCA